MPSQANNPIQPEVITPTEYELEAAMVRDLESEAADAIAGQYVDDVAVSFPAGRPCVSVHFKGRYHANHCDALREVAGAMVAAGQRLLKEVG